MFLNRTMCDVLEEMRKCYKTRNFASILGLVEEAQGMANRMESAIYDIKEIASVSARWKECKEKDRALRLLKEDIERKARIAKGET